MENDGRGGGKASSSRSAIRHILPVGNLTSANQHAAANANTPPSFSRSTPSTSCRQSVAPRSTPRTSRACLAIIIVTKLRRIAEHGGASSRHRRRFPSLTMRREPLPFLGVISDFRTHLVTSSTFISLQFRPVSLARPDFYREQRRLSASGDETDLV